MDSEQPPQFDRPLHHLRDHHHHHPPPPSREQRPFQSSSTSKSDKKVPFKGAVPFNRVQLAAALIEYNDSPYHNDPSGINWDIQEITHQPVAPLKQAPHSAIFIPFRQTLPSKPPDFFSGLELNSSPKSYPQSFSGFGLVSEPGIPKFPETINVEQRRFSENVVIQNTEQDALRNRADDNELEVLSEWGLDKLLSGNLTESTSTPDRHSQQINHPQIAEANSSRPPQRISERQEVKSDMFDFHFSELRLHSDQDTHLFKTSSTRNFLTEMVKNEDLNLVIDDETLLRQRVGCDPEGRKLLRPQSVMELKETQLLYQNPRTRLSTISNTKQFAMNRGRALPLTSQRAVLENRMKASSKSNKTQLRTKSLSPTRLVGPASIAPHTTSNRTRQHSASRSSMDLVSASVPVRARRKSVLDEPSTHRLNFKPLTPSRRLSRPVSPKPNAQNLNSEPKPKRRTSADIVERYQKSIALLEGRKSEDMTYDVPNQLGSSLGGSQQGQDGRVTDRDNDSTMLTRFGSASHSQSDFSIGAPRQFTSRFDPKVAPVLSQTTSTGMSQADELPDEQDDGESLGGRDEEIQGNLKDENLELIYDEHRRIRFPASLKPMVLIMPIPLTPAQPEPDEPDEENFTEAGQEEVDSQEKAKQEQIQKLKQVRPAGKLYGRSLIDELNSRTATQKSKQMAFGSNRKTKLLVSSEDASRPGSIYPTEDLVPEMQLRAPNNMNSRLHLANQAVRNSQYKFNQALVNSSKARQSVFGIDMVMKAELEKLKKIKAIEEKELHEEEIKVEAKQAKKQAKKRGKKNINSAQESKKVEHRQDEINNRLSRMDNWDAILEREVQPDPDSESKHSAALEVRETRYFTPLPLLPALISPNQNLVSNMDDWFKDKRTESSDGHTPPKNSMMGLDNENEFGSENTLARKLEIQVENVKYKPLPNLFESHHMVRPNSVQSQTAFLSSGPSGNTPNMLRTSSRTQTIDEDPEQEEVLNVLSQKTQHLVLDQSSFLAHEEDDDNVPLSMKRNSNFPKFNLEIEDDDNRPLSMIGNKLAPTSVRSPIRSTSSTHDSDEELPLGIRASILLSQKHPPIDLTRDAESSDGPIGSNTSDESDLVPLGLQTSILRSYPSEAFHPIPSLAYPNIQQPTTTDVDSSASNLNHTPGDLSNRDGGRGYNLGGSDRIYQASIARSIGGRSDDIPLGTRLRQPPGVSAFNPTFPYSDLSPILNHPLQAHYHSFSNIPQAPNITSNFGGVDDNDGDDDDDDDDVPIGRRITLGTPLASKVGLQDEQGGKDEQPPQEIDRVELLTETRNSESTEIEVEPTPDVEVHSHRRRAKIKLRNPIVSQIIVDESVAREDTLAALEGRGNLEEHADDDVPLGVTRAAHSVAANGTLHRERTRKRKEERERKQGASKVRAEWKSLTNKFQKDRSVQQGNLDSPAIDHTSSATSVDNDDQSDDDDDVPLGMSHHTSVLNLTAPQRKQNDSDDDDLPLGMHVNLDTQLLQRQLTGQQNHGIGFQQINSLNQDGGLGRFSVQHPPQIENLRGQNPGSFIYHQNQFSFDPHTSLDFNLNYCFPPTNLQSNSLLPLTNGQDLDLGNSLNLNHPSSVFIDSHALNQSESNISKWRQDILE